MAPQNILDSLPLINVESLFEGIPEIVDRQYQRAIPGEVRLASNIVLQSTPVLNGSCHISGEIS